MALLNKTYIYQSGLAYFMQKSPLPCIFVIFGATGDLTHKKLMPALYMLKKKKLLPNNFCIVAVARKEKTHDDFRKDIFNFIRDKQIWKEFSSMLYYYRQDFNDDSFSGLKVFLAKLDRNYNTMGNRIFYLATLPIHFDSIVKNMKKAHFFDKSTYRIMIEKPFGHDLDSAKTLNKQLCSVFKEDQIYRTDHYLGKEAVQNLFALRFANKIFDAVWNSEHIANIQITVAENIGVETRGSYYDKYGAIKDMVQNHLLQILSLIAMELPKEFTAKEIKNQKVRVLKSVKFRDLERSIVLGQYSGKHGYLTEQGVNQDSKTETFASLRFYISNKRWKNIPFYLRTGKQLKSKISEVVIHFKKMNIFEKQVFPNVLVIRLHPEEGIDLGFNIKEPGNAFEIKRVDMKFCHKCLFGINTPEAYEKLLYDALLGDATLFTGWDEVMASWKIIDPIFHYTEKLSPIPYEIGTWGPEESSELLAKDNFHWRDTSDL